MVIVRKALGIVILVLLLAVIASAVPRYRAVPPVAGQSWTSLPMERLEKAWQYLQNATDTCFEGEIASVLLKRPLAILKVETDEGYHNVLLHPLWNWAGVEIITGEQIQVEGKLVNFGGKEYVFPLKVTLKGKTLDFTQYLSSIHKKIARLRNRVPQGYWDRCPGWRYPRYRAPRFCPPARTPGYRW